MDEKHCCNDFAYFVTTNEDDFTHTNKLIYHDIRFDEYKSDKWMNQKEIQ